MIIVAPEPTSQTSSLSRRPLSKMPQDRPIIARSAFGLCCYNIPQGAMLVLIPGLGMLITGACLWGAEDHTDQLTTDLSQTPLICLILGGVLTFLGLIWYLANWIRHMPRRKRKDETAKSRGVELRSIYIPQEVLDDPSFGRNSLPAYSTIFPEEGAAGDTSTRSSGNFKYAFVNLAGPSANGDDPRNSYKAAMGNPVYNNPKGASSNAKGKDKHYAVSASPAATTGSGNAKAAQGQGHQQQKGAVVVSGGASGVDNTAFTSSFSSLEGTY